MRGWLVVPGIVLVGLVIGLPAVALTESGIEKDLKEAVGFDLDSCDPSVNLASSWLEGPALVEPRDEPRAVAVGGQVYLVGGTLGIEEIADERFLLDSTDQLTRFDPRTGRYEELAPLPRPLNHVGLTAYRGDVYVGGGYSRLNDADTSSAFFRYDPETGRWARLPDMPAPRAAGAVGVIGDRLIWAGGAKDGVARSEVFAYDFDSRRWSRLPSMATRREHVGEAVLDGKLYVLGGRAPHSLAVDTAERFDPRTGRWETLPPMPVGSGGLAAVAFGDAVATIAGGDDAAETVTGAVQEYDPAKEEWRLLPEVRTARHGHGAALAGDDVWVFGGSHCAYFDPTETVEHIPVQELRRER
jgi:N-acetylneuraminic acid mutarotase